MTQDHKLLILPATQNSEQIIKQTPYSFTLTKGHFQNIRFLFHHNELNILHEAVDIRDFDSIWLSSHWNSRDLAYGIKQYLSYHNKPCTYVEPSTSKVTDQIAFVLNGIRTPDLFFSPSHEVALYIDEIERICGYPFIIKDSKGSRGKLSVLINSREELFSAAKKFSKRKRYVFQKFVKNDYEWGILVSNGVVVSAEKSYPSEGEFRNNACNGAKEVFVPVHEVPEEVLTMAIQGCNSLGLSWSRADILVEKSTGTPYLLEVNRFPGITEDSTEVSGAAAFLASIMV